MPDTGIGVVITGKEIYDAVMETKGTVARIEEKFSSLTSTVQDHTAALEEHDGKLEDLYRKYYQIAGIGGMVGGAVLAVVQAVIKAVFGG